MKISQKGASAERMYAPVEKVFFNQFRNHTGDGFKDRDLDGKLPDYRAIGTCWDNKRHLFNFKTDFKEKHMTQTGMSSNVGSLWSNGLVVNLYHELNLSSFWGQSNEHQELLGT